VIASILNSHAEIGDKQKKIGYDSNLRRSARTSLLVQVSGGALTRSSSVNPAIKDKIQHFG
jgi:hypothetical protein